VQARTGKRKVIITCAVTGSVHTPSMSQYLPITPAQIADQAIEAARAGAAVLHLHARDPADGSPTPDPAVFEQFVPRITAETDAIINITTGGSARMTLEERLAYPLRARPELCSLNMGSMNFSFHRAGRGIKGWKHAWEKAHVEGSEVLIFRNTFTDIKSVLSRLATHMARASNSSATMSAISTIWPISSMKGSSRSPCSCNVCSVSSAGSIRIPRTSS